MTDQQKDQSSQKPKTPAPGTDKGVSDKKDFKNLQPGADKQSGGKEQNAGKDQGGSCG